MEIISDFHMHSRYSRACSKDLNVENLEKYARLKGINLLGTGDFTHPLWLKELKEKLKEDGTGILRSKTGFDFVLSSEVSSIYSQDKKGRRIHNLILAPDFETVDRINEALVRKGANLKSDGRPIFGIPCHELVAMLMDIDRRVEVIPAHVWTPWFGLFGSKSGFDSVEECFEEQAKHIHALETGLSSDPAMNWRVSSLDKYALVSNSDAHSFWPWRMGREANVFDLKELSYDSFLDVIRSESRRGFLYTIEVDPSYGKYHFDGHRNCNVSMNPAESRKQKGICPVCRRLLTVGVLSRVEELADRPYDFRPENAVPFKSLLPLSEIIAAVKGVPVFNKVVWDVYAKYVKEFVSEINAIVHAEGRLLKGVDEKVGNVILKIRENEIRVEPGYDGEYGRLLLDGEAPRPSHIMQLKKQRTLSDY